MLIRKINYIVSFVCKMISILLKNGSHSCHTNKKSVRLDALFHADNPRRGCRRLNAVSQPRSTRWVFAETFLPSSLTNGRHGIPVSI
ncbi:hypothetical protein GTNG_1453 [Geobacillus thermodenitrificans NG80-2]|uniref:Uncharacterized protein n=1 Tax=Geobacillus thermodenitrificans (strain NG80-2) TaxID=420246 RepID=A4INB9_GEOTN|nr:hypothetical protein GTNG_1453 [Geobacillus thermodenitrificans NG80-2]